MILPMALAEGFCAPGPPTNGMILLANSGKGLNDDRIDGGRGIRAPANPLL
jgi:hypothetical protein